MLTNEKLAQLNQGMLQKGAPTIDDGKGYNKPDWNIARTIAYGISDSQALTIANLLLKYTSTQALVSKDELETYINSHHASSSACPVSIVKVLSDKTQITFPFDRGIIDIIKSSGGGWFDPSSKTWFIKNASMEKLLGNFKLKGYEVSSLESYYNKVSTPTVKEEHINKIKITRHDFKDVTVFSEYNEGLKHIYCSFGQESRSYDYATKSWTLSNHIITTLIDRIKNLNDPSIDYSELESYAKLLSNSKDDMKDFKLKLPEGTSFKPFEHQTKAAYELVKHKRYLLADEMGAGKQQPIDTKVLTPDGWKAIGNLQVGDYVIGSNGKPTKVLGLFPQGIKPSYRVTFSDKSSVEAGPEHLWTIFRRNKKRNHITMTTNEIRKIIPENISDRTYNNTLYIPTLSSPVEFNIKNDLPVSPYTLGLNIKSGDKFIPEIYKTASVHDRIALLQGLMDSDGSVSISHNKLSYSTTSNRLAYDVMEIVEGLGGIASISTYDRASSGRSVEYAVRIRMPEGILPFRLKRKADRYNLGKLAKPVRTIVSVEYVRDVESMCIKVEAEDMLYVTEHCILTHNTLSSIYAAYNIPGKRIIICPASVKFNWRKELSIFGIPFDEILVIKTDKDADNIENYNWVIINYDILNKLCIVSGKKITPKLWIKNFTTAIFDEAHYCKTINKYGKPQSLRAKYSYAISQCIENVFLLTGTPITNKTKDIYNLLMMINANSGVTGGSWNSFANYFCGATYTRWGWMFDGATHREELNRRLQPVMLRRKTEDILTLPDIIRSYIPCDVNLAEYKRQIKECLKHYKTASAAQQLMMYTAMRLTIAKSKVKDTISFAKDVIENDKSIVIFTNFQFVIDSVMEAFAGNVVKIDGSVSAENRQKAIDAFQNGDMKVIVCNVAAGGVGITLTRASTLIFNDYAWLPSDMEQAACRIYRIGQKEKCNIFYMYAEGCGIDEDMTKKLNKKMENIGIVIDGKADQLISDEDLSFGTDYFMKYLDSLEEEA